MLRAVLLAALMAGTLSGALLTVIQQWQVIPLIQQAELGETRMTEHDHSGANQEHHHDQAWEPQDGIERGFYTLLSNVLAGIGFSFMLVAAMVLVKADGWRRGLIWGAAAFAVFFVAPALGLPPKLPGTVAAALKAQQLWWLMTVVASATALSLLVYARAYVLKGLGVLLLLSPHLLGAPVPELASALPVNPGAVDFILATSVANAVYWLVMGAAAGYGLRRLLNGVVAGNGFDRVSQQ